MDGLRGKRNYLHQCLVNYLSIVRLDCRGKGRKRERKRERIMIKIEERKRECNDSE